MNKKVLLVMIMSYGSLVCAQYKAVVCGISDYPAANYAAYCSADAKAAAHHLANLPNWSGAEITLLTNEAATKSALNNAIDDMVASAVTDDVCVFFFSGRSASGLIYAYDAEITFNEIASRMANMAAGNYVILIDMGVPAGSTAVSPLTPVNQPPATSQGISILSYYEYLDDPLYEVAKNSPFTYLLLEALSGYGDTNYDGFISAQECAYHINLDIDPIIVAENTAGVAISTTNIAYNDIYEVDTSTINPVIPTDGTPIMRAIRPANELDYVKFSIAESAVVEIETNSGSIDADTVIYLYKSSVSTANLIAQDDDTNYYLSKITKTLDAGTYYVNIKEYSTSTIDSYTVRVSMVEQQLFIAGPDFLYNGSSGEFRCLIDNAVSGSEVAAQWLSDNPAAWFDEAVLHSQVSADTQVNVTAYYNESSKGKQVKIRDAQAPGGSVEYYAVLCGIADYPGTANDLSYTVDDALALRDRLLRDPWWKSENITMLLDSEATYAAINAAIANMAAMADSDDVCLFFYSGHGTTVADAYPYDEADGLDECLVAYDANIRDDVFGQWINALPTDNYIVLIDCCFSGGQIKTADITPGASVKGIGKAKSTGGDGFAADIKGAVIGIEDLNDNGRGVVLTASDDFELSWELGSLRHGVFTYHLLAALDGAADTDGDGFVSAEECYHYIYPLALGYQTTQIYDASPLAMPIMQYNSAKYVSSISISGQSVLSPESNYNYTCTADYSDGSSADITNAVKWQSTSSEAAMAPDGTLTTGAVGSNTDVGIKAVYNNLHSVVFDAVIHLEKYSGGDGTPLLPYLIGTAADLALLCQSQGDWGGSFLLTADIDMTAAAFTPIGTDWEAPFSGSFDGGGYEIRNLSINAAQTDYVGLFGILDFDAEVTRLGLLNVNVVGGTGTGAIAGWSTGAIKRCFATGYVSGGVYVGGIAGGISGSAIIEDCYSLCNVEGSDMTAGITATSAAGATINRALAAGTVYSPTAAAITNYYEANKITACFYDFVKTAVPDNGAGTPISGVQLKTADVFTAAGWDFSASGNWKIKTGYTPLLKWQSDFTPGDFNNDDRINTADLLIFAASWLQSGGSACDISQYGGDGIVDMKDLSILYIYWLNGE